MAYAETNERKSGYKRVFEIFCSAFFTAIVAAFVCSQSMLAADTPKAAANESVEWEDDFNKALDEKRSKLIMVDVYTPWCIFCKKLENVTYPDPTVSNTLKKKFICVKLNAEDNANGTAFCKKFGSGAYPTIYFFDHDQFRDKPKAKIIGYLPPDNFETVLEEVEKATEYKQYRHKDFVKQDVTSHSEAKPGTAPAAAAQTPAQAVPTQTAPAAHSNLQEPPTPPTQRKSDDF